MRRNYLLAALAASPMIAYGVLFFGMMIEGDLLVFTSGFLMRRGVLDPFYTFGIALAGGILGDLLWFTLGRINTERNSFLRWIGDAADRLGSRIDDHIVHRTFRTLFISKFVYGVHHFTLVRAGRRGMALGKLLQNDLPASIGWILIVGGTGYLASASFELVRRRVHFFEIALLLAIAIYFILAESVSKALKKKL